MSNAEQGHVQEEVVVEQPADKELIKDRVLQEAMARACSYSMQCTPENARDAASLGAYLGSAGSLGALWGTTLQAWATFCWMVSHIRSRDLVEDEDGYIFCRGGRRAARAQRALEERTAGFQGFAALFLELCSAQRLECVIVEGKLRGLDGFGKDRRHYWNAVRFGPRWALIDCSMAARKFASQGKLGGLCKDGILSVAWFFDIDTEQAGFSYLPADPEWQLLPKCSLGSSEPMSVSEFGSCPMPTHNFFDLSLTMLSHRSSGVLTLRGNTGTLRFGVPEGMSFKGVLKGSRRACVVMREGSTLALHFRAPPGESDLVISAVLIDGEGNEKCEPVEVITYRIQTGVLPLSSSTAVAIPGPHVQDLFLPHLFPPFFRCNLRFQKAEADGLPPSSVTILKGSAHVEILLEAPKDVQIQASLQELEEPGPISSEAQHLTFVNREVCPQGDGLVHIRIGRPGHKFEQRWLHVVCRRNGDAKFSRAFSMMVVVQGDSMTAACALPTQFQPFWHIGCFLHEPMIGSLQAGVLQRFRLTMARDVLHVVVTFDGKLEQGEQAWHNLKVEPANVHHDLKARIFHAFVPIPKKATAATVLLAMDRKSGSLISLLKYSVVAKAEEKKHSNQKVLPKIDDERSKLVGEILQDLEDGGAKNWEKMASDEKLWISKPLKSKSLKHSSTPKVTLG